MEEIEETHRMIQQMEELVALTPGDPELLQTLSDLYDLLNIQLVQANTNQPSEDEEQQQGELFEEMLSPGSNVIYKSQQENEEVWKPGQVIKQTDGAKGRQWEVSTLEGVIITVDLQNIRPSQYHNQVVTKAEHSDNESVTETSSMNEEELDDQFDIVPKHWGGWEAHSTGFASRMMSKMGYVPGQGLGVSGQGRLDPIEAAKRNTNKSFNNMDRPGLGLNVKKKHKKNKVKNKKTAENREEQVDMFGFMDTLLSSNQSNVPEKISTPSSSAAIPSTDREANRSIAKIQSKIESTQVEYNSAAAAVRRNKGKPMESQFQAKLEKVAKLLADLKNEANTMKGHVKRRRERESMHTF